MNEIKFTPGTVCDVAHLRPFDLEKALAGHPLADRSGRSIRLFRQLGRGTYAFDCWLNGEWISHTNYEANLSSALRLAPLAIKDGRPLHVGDEIETLPSTHTYWRRNVAYLSEWLAHRYNEKNASYVWRWPEGEK